MGPFEELIKNIDGELLKLNRLKQAIFFQYIANTLFPLYVKFSVTSGLRNHLRMAEIVEETWNFLSNEPSNIDGEKLKDESYSLGGSEEDNMVEEAGNAQCFGACLWNAIDCHMSSSENKTTTWYPLNPMFMTVGHKLFGIVQFGNDEKSIRMEREVLSNEQFKKELKKVEMCIAQLGTDMRPKSELISFWKDNAIASQVDPADYV
jgi:hypothetical protein